MRTEIPARLCGRSPALAWAARNLPSAPDEMSSTKRVTTCPDAAGMVLFRVTYVDPERGVLNE